MKLSLTRLAGAATVLLLIATPGCRGDDDLLIGFDCGQELCDDPPRFTPTPDGGPATSPEAGAFVGMCPSNECPAGRTTCPNDPFPCSVDLTSDDDNCGACGVRCPHDDAFIERFAGAMRCTAGACRLVCAPSHADCNGIADDGCEVQIAGPGATDINNCGACGNVCDDLCSEGACGCPGGGTFCPDGSCHDLNREDENCGACGNVCPPSTDPPLPPEWNMVRACRAGACNQVSCAPGQADCNGDASIPNGDGCETNTMWDAENCGGCGNKCAAGEDCIIGRCLCACGSVCFSSINSDPNNCGACGLKCPGDWSSVTGNVSFGFDPAHGRPTCDQGVCGYACSPNFADCDGNIDNGCETPMLDDPLNCGACGVRCDGVAGQACVDGQCLMKECGVVQ
ncbi:MAG: hypothetical protein BGO98_30620 [Myxococcales bacterium 68-20]|nr:MAG: hypothetical protein BGO98_30620 [Myxococcales bacterium 68-20]